ncbi:DUF3037 domain-containing protein [Rhodocyclus purpureus]|uniref:DUF3037 domain-containing protein n=1 Tax=Rhodocyclus purpureus TaxID=1067 RepID=UPI001912A981|nr:DUF3037 domain-containing protein [Rhodocyclus purpureus]MBK5915575.1 hypothetical protein [Rhodocyclus purpureus]
MKRVCQYAVVQFMPYVETREFANVGVVLMCPEDGFFGFRLLKRYGRVTRFFEGLDQRIFLEGKRLFQDELTRIRGVLKSRALDKRRATIDDAGATRAFAELVRRREALFRFDEPAVMLAEDPKQALEEIYGFHVERNFATREYQERLLEKGIRRLLFAADLGERYREEVIGDDVYHARFPFVSHAGEHPDRVIKPLFLRQDEPARIYTHGDLWIAKVRRLRARNLLPAHMLIPIEAPAVNDEGCFSAFAEVRGELLALNVEVVDAMESERILKFAGA